ncbi:hypothetical protein V8E52_005000 [Russula decolorans]
MATWFIESSNLVKQVHAFHESKEANLFWMHGKCLRRYEPLYVLISMAVVPKIAAKDTTLTCWKDPHKFMPERFFGDWPKDAFISFSQAVINMLVSRYRFKIEEEPEFAGETSEERHARITAFDQIVTTTLAKKVLFARFTNS